MNCNLDGVAIDYPLVLTNVAIATDDSSEIAHM